MNPLNMPAIMNHGSTVLGGSFGIEQISEAVDICMVHGFGGPCVGSALKGVLLLVFGFFAFKG